MCKVLKIAKSTYYYKEIPHQIDIKFENAVIDEFKKSRNNYGTRKLKIVLKRRRFAVSRRRIGKVMKKYGLVSKYTLRQKKKKKSNVNEDEIANVLDRQFDGRAEFEVVVSDLTYIKIGGKWHYLCTVFE
jgi:transposase InsO family protein